MDIICEGLMLGNSGFAEAMRSIVLALDKKGVHVKTVIHDENNIGDCPEIKRLLELRNTPMQYGKKPWITMTYPLGIQPHADYYSIAYAMFETEEFPQDFVRQLSGNDEVWTPSTFCRNSMEKAGLKDVHVMPLGVDIERFNPETTMPMALPEEYQDKFIFLSIFGWSRRKGVYLLSRAFAEEFKEQKDVALYLKGGWYNERRARREVFNHLGDLTGIPPIKVDFEIYQYSSLPSLYKACDCFVMPTRGEGWGLEFSEAMAMEMPTIGTRWSGNTEFMNDENAYMVEINGTVLVPECDWITPYYVGQKFADPDINSLKKHMRYVYEHRKEAKEKGKYARQFMAQNYTWDMCADRIINRLNTVYA